MTRTAFFDHPDVIAMAHRGFTNGPGAPENSLPAFAAAVDLGFRYVETDVHATVDGTLIAFHDDRLERVTDGSGVIAERPWSVVRQAKIAGTQEIPTLDMVLESWPELRVNIDCKAESAVQPLVEVIERHRAHDRVCVASFSDERRRAVLRRLSRPVATSGGRSVISRFVVGGRTPAWARIPLGQNALRDVDCLQVPRAAGRIRVVTDASLRRAHNAGVQVHVWTIDDETQMQELLDLGVDGIMTDRADRLRDVLVARGQWVS
ncbi:MAG TPA: glycerophosphodiester phosphodiesterase [Flexivirga sp.]|uniref:glycerophosphodiester phosphodiesterase n=1 Tax=Flexivirga sp. TaxID=1962927 RepID=UPI002BD78764|nr:glycerophosphodiester phosphodiesterase [Flexivirga sp.]HWC20815.1 glycerophosphodiester phosphodiesterase [Flexivirga sp.]